MDDNIQYQIILLVFPSFSILFVPVKDDMLLSLG